MTTRPRITARLAALGAAAALALGLAPMPAATAATTELETGGLTWGVRESFRDYIGASGVTVSGGASQDADSIITFPLASGTFDDATGATTLEFTGSVHYLSYCGYFDGWKDDECVLDVEIRDPKIVIDVDRQVLTAHVIHRPGGVNVVTPMRDLGVIPLVDLDVSEATVDVDGGETSWGGIRTGITTEAVPVFGYYSVGAAFDPLSFTYEGPGGRPEFRESWTEPGTVSIAQTDLWTDPLSTTEETAVFVDRARELVHVVNVAPVVGGAPVVQALDAETLDVVGDSGGFGTAFVASSVIGRAFDEETSTVFIYAPSSSAARDVWALSWNGDGYDSTLVGTIGSTVSPVSALAWDAVNDRLFLRGQTGTAQYLFVFERDGGHWTTTTETLQVPAGWRFSNYFASTNSRSGLAVASDGSLILGRRTVETETTNGGVVTRLKTQDPLTLRLTYDGTDVAVEELVGSGVGTISASAATVYPAAVVAGPGGRIAIIKMQPDSSTAILFGRITGGVTTFAAQPQVIPTSATGQVESAFDPEDGSFWAKDYAVGKLYGFSPDGELVTTFGHDLSYSNQPIVVGAGHAIYTTTRDAGRLPGVARLDRLGISPTVATQPEPTSVSIVRGATSATATFAATATGSPMPTVQWQSKSAGSLKFADVAGATSTTLELPVTSSLGGTAYRAVFTNAAGAIATQTAGLTVLTAPSVLVQPLSTRVSPGEDVQLLVMPSGNPEPSVTWQRFSAGSWRDITASEQFAPDGAYLTISKLASSQSDLRVRSSLTNSVGTTFSDEAIITVGSTAVTPQGSLTWGVKSSFRSYIVGPVARGSISVSDGATTTGGAFVFGQRSRDFDSGTGTGTSSYRGAVRFTGHDGVLDLTLANPVVRIESTAKATLLVTVNGRQTPIGAVNLAAANKRTVAGGVAYSNAPVSLTAAGVGAFSNGSSQFYSAGTAMDALSFVIGATSSGVAGSTTVAAFTETEWTPPATPPVTVGASIDPDAEPRVGQELTAWADGFEPNEDAIKVVLYSEPRVLEANLVADASGRATWSGLIPADLPPGTHTLTFQGTVDRGLVLDVLPAASLEGCQVTASTLDWGFKESFRSYISGSIANGEWELLGGASYETPEFGWSGGAGTFDVKTGRGLVQWPGGIRFTGHDGVLDTTIENPQVRFVDADTAYLLLDVSGPTMDGDPVDADGVSFVELSLTGAMTVSEDGLTVTGTAVPTEITTEGNEAFPNYEAGTAFDPLNFSFAIDPACVIATPVVEPSTEVTPPAGVAPLWPWIVGGLVLLAALAAVTIVLVRRRTATVR